MLVENSHQIGYNTRLTQFIFIHLEVLGRKNFHQGEKSRILGWAKRKTCHLSEGASVYLS